jgi:hypothetical protein
MLLLLLLLSAAAAAALMTCAQLQPLTPPDSLESTLTRCYFEQSRLQTNICSPQTPVRQSPLQLASGRWLH